MLRQLWNAPAVSQDSQNQFKEVDSNKSNYYGITQRTVLKMVSSINDVTLLELVKADIEHFTDHETDIIDELTFSDREELTNLAEVPDNTNTLTEGEYRESTKKWRMN